MNQVNKIYSEGKPQTTDVLTDALSKANEIDELHKGPVDVDFLKNNQPGEEGRSGANSAGDSGE